MAKKVWIFILCILLIFSSVRVMASSKQEDRISIFNNIDIEEPVAGSVVSVFGNINTRDSVGGDVVAIFGNIYVNAAVKGNVVAVFGNVSLGPQADVRGDVVAIGSKNIQKASGSKIAGDSIGISIGSINLPFFHFRFSLPFMNRRGFLSSIGLLIIALCSLLVISVAKERIMRISYCVEDNIVRKIIIGTVLFLCFPIITILMAITIIGLPIAVIFLMIAFLVGFSALCSYIGRKVLDLFDSTTNIYEEYLVGVLVLAILMSVIRYSWLIGCAVVILSLGLAFDAGFGSKIIHKEN
ncbi:MAG: hypothetical protein GX066_07000 [Clostridiaceae bacterium]|nr:hypothetical protein [Clostridiaceae bacterium]